MGASNEIAKNQIKFASDEGIHSYTIPEKWLIGEKYLEMSFLPDLVYEIKKAFSKGGDFMLSTSPVRHPDVHTKSLPGRKHALIAQNTGLIIKSVMEKIFVSGLIVFGGDTLMGIMQALECKSIEPLLEIEPGLALSTTIMNNKSCILSPSPEAMEMRISL